MALRDDLEYYESGINGLTTISGQINALKGSVTGLKNDLINSFNIDDKGLEEERLTTIINVLNGTSSSITSTVNDLRNKVESTKEAIKREEEEKRRRREEEEEEQRKKDSKNQPKKLI